MISYVQSGDATVILPFVLLFVGAGAILAYLIIKNKKNKK